MFVFTNESTCAVIEVKQYRIAAPRFTVRSWVASADHDANKAAELWQIIRDAAIMTCDDGIAATEIANQAIVTYLMRKGYDPQI